MADASHITVTVEQAIHARMREFCQAIADEHGIMIESARLSWIDISTPAEIRQTVGAVTMTTTQRHA